MALNIIDNFLSQEELHALQHGMLSDEFKWTLTNSVAPDTICDDLYNFQLFHIFYQSPFIVSDQFDLVNSILSKIKPQVLLRVKANFVPSTHNVVVHGYHKDVPNDIAKISKTAIFYLNTNDGFTLFKSGERVDSVENRLVMFDANEEHSGTTCTDQKYRVVINLNFLA